MQVGLVRLHEVDLRRGLRERRLVVGSSTSSEAGPALYFSTVTYFAIGYGELTLAKRWRILGAIEGANGFILLG
ncbi:ion channel [Phenylobacterium ferrooxidans]|uniref:ion channel n=1 Tax=Phenylobacterium ferrooxidans TaxID=2982689 RepID=UPI0036724C87